MNLNNALAPKGMPNDTVKSSQITTQEYYTSRVVYSNKGNRNRRKPRQKSKKSDTSVENGNLMNNEEISILLDSFKIEAVSDHTCGRAIRKRDILYSCVNLKSFSITNQPYVFISQVCKTTIANSVVSVGNFKHSSSIVNKKKDKEKKKEKRNRDKSKNNLSNKKTRAFPEYLSLEAVENGLSDGSLIKGIIRINSKNYKSAYVSNENLELQDYLISSIEDRNRALEGDEVVLVEKPQSEWVDYQKTAKVVHILEKCHSRRAVGFLKLMPDKNKQFALFVPRDKRVPRIRIPNVSWPQNFYKKEHEYQDVLFLAEITEWNDTRYAIGFIIDNIGISGELKAETTAILLEHCLNVEPYDSNISQYYHLPKEISQEEFRYREDLRGECIFTIDPMTARDLDDAVSCKKLTNGNYEVGVHISDVAYYLAENNYLDKVVCQKATTVYLTDSTYHMLPLELCLYCSLLPGVDKTAFSVIWEMDKDGNILKTRFARTVINSSAKLAYEHAYKMIENPYDEPENLPEIHNGFNFYDLSAVVNNLQGIALKLRKNRFENGALRLDQPKLCFELDPTCGEPINWSVYEITDAHRLIEEFMLLANGSVAAKINDSFPDLAFLRCHDPPKQRLLKEIQKNLESVGINIDVTSSAALQESLWKYCGNDSLDIPKTTVLNHLIAKPMQRAKYFCAAKNDNYHHYALNIPIYTHFTSPIRRYADIVVHRLLAASLGYVEKPTWKVADVSKIAENCNVQKYRAKKAGEASCDLYFAHFVEANQPFIQDAVIVDIKDKSFDAIIMKTGTVVRVYATTNESDDNIEWKILDNTENNKNAGTSNCNGKDKKIFKVQITFPADSKYPVSSKITIEMFSVVQLSLERKSQTNSVSAKIVRPIQ